MPSGKKNYTETNSMVEYYDICILEGRVNDAKQKHLHQQSSHKQQSLRQSLIQRHNITPSWYTDRYTITYHLMHIYRRITETITKDIQTNPIFKKCRFSLTVNAKEQNKIQINEKKEAQAATIQTDSPKMGWWWSKWWSTKTLTTNTQTNFNTMRAKYNLAR